MVDSIESEELLEIVKSPPSLPIRVGSLLVSAVILFFLIFSAFVKFPDNQIVELSMQSDSPVSRIFSTKAAYIDSILVENESHVQEGQNLLLYSSIVPWGQLNALKRNLEILLYTDTLYASHLDLAKYQELPDLFDQLIQLESIFSRIQLLMRKQSFYKNEMQRKKKRIELVRRISLAENRLSIIKQKWIIEHQLFVNDSLLFADSVISRSEYLKSQSKQLDLSDHLIGIKRELSSLRSSLIEHDQQSLEELFSIEAELIQTKAEASNGIKQALVLIEGYQISNSVRTLQSGLIRQDLPFEKGMYIPENTQLFSIQSQNNVLFAISEVKSEYSGKLRTGQKALIEFDAYPSTQYGFIEGIIQEINPVIKEGNYTLRISLPNQLFTDRGIQLSYLPEMTGTARIICEEQTLLEKLLFRFDRKFSI